MRIPGVYRALVSVDFANVARDGMLGWMLAGPPLVALLIRVQAPALDAWVPAALGLELHTFHGLLAGLFVLMVPTMVGMAGGFLLLDERDERILIALLVTPTSLRSYLVYRIGAPWILGLAVTVVCYPLLDVAPLAPVPLVLVALLASLTAPITALFLAAFAADKVSGFALVKVHSAVSMLAVVALLVPEPWQLAAGLVPAYWPMKALLEAASGNPWALWLAAGLPVNALVLVLLSRTFETRVRHG